MTCTAKFRSNQRQTIQQCCPKIASTVDIYTTNVSLGNVYTLFCVNATPTKNRTWWVDYVTILDSNPGVHTNNLVRVSSTCINTAINHQKNVFHFNITFPQLPKCRVKRAWYDTLLGAFGASAGVINAIDSETLAYKAKRIGTDINQRITLQAQWLPTVFEPQQMTLQYDKSFLNLVNYAEIAKLQVDVNITYFMNWTTCTLQHLFALIQRNKAQDDLMTNSEYLWRRIFHRWIPSANWVLITPNTVVCTTDLFCSGQIVHFNVTEQCVLCTFIILPIVFVNEFWLPHFSGNYIRTDTINGAVCGQHSPLYEPCLLQHSINVCPLTILPANFSMFIEISAQYICLASYDINVTYLYNLSYPFCGCFTNVTHLWWHGQLYTFVLDMEQQLTLYWYPQVLNIADISLSLQPLRDAIQKTELLQQYLQKRNKTLLQHQTDTTLTGDTLVDISSRLQKATTHNWWDIFSGHSPSATKALNLLFHPILIILCIIIILTIWNCYLTHYMRKISHSSIIPLSYKQNRKA
ncbi:uncharacterized protein LOC115481745 [Microcaecilia unicolor]|uniref:Uncharacterized protein LOC115481745 n=1 Tax=Microcaecilia unicolor TaxID=1415580 RepID=A0A6P7ZQG8_9AMPH|nr:uncharacterized protein LOC115481745 [Microcaecilia unicolor]